MKSQPLSLQELREMAGKPVWCPELKVYGIIKCEQVGDWAGIPFLHGCRHHASYGTAVDFELNIQSRKLKCYRVEDAEIV